MTFDSDADFKPWNAAVKVEAYRAGYEAGLRDAAVYGAEFILKRRGQWTAELEASSFVEERPRLRRRWRRLRG